MKLNKHFIDQNKKKQKISKNLRSFREVKYLSSLRRNRDKRGGKSYLKNHIKINKHEEFILVKWSPNAQ